MAKKRSLASSASNVVIAWAFIVGVVAAVVIGIFGATFLAEWQGALISLLVVAGIIVGFFNISPEETNNYLLAAVSLVIVSSLGGQALAQVDMIGMYLSSIFNALMAFIVPAVIVVGLKAVYYVAKD